MKTLTIHKKSGYDDKFTYTDKKEYWYDFLSVYGGVVIYKYIGLDTIEKIAYYPNDVIWSIYVSDDEE